MTLARERPELDAGARFLVTLAGAEAEWALRHEPSDARWLALYAHAEALRRAVEGERHGANQRGECPHCGGHEQGASRDTIDNG